MNNNIGAVKRLRKELQSLEKSAKQYYYQGAAAAAAAAACNNHTKEDTTDNIHLRPTSPSSLLHWTAYIQGPRDSPYENGVFQLSIQCGLDYPLAPPTITFVTKIFHPNVHFEKGDVCLDILKKEWSPAWGLQAACRAVLALLSDPDATSPLNCDAGNMIRNGDYVAFWTTAEMYTVENACFVEWPVLWE